jgi:hypothetical protein
MKKIKLILHEPISKIVDTISNDPDSRHYQNELTELKKYKNKKMNS